MKDQVFTSSLPSKHESHAGRLWVADTLDLALGLLSGWALVRYLDIGSAWGKSAAVIIGTWVVYATVAGAAKQTLWRWVMGVNLVARDKSPGFVRAFARAFTVLPDHVLLAVFRIRRLDWLLGVRPEGGSPRRLSGLLRHLPFAAALAVALYLIVIPTRSEAQKFLNTLDGWRCCNGRLRSGMGRCTRALNRVASDARRHDAEAEKVVAACPEAKRRL